jgi:hypothetical protein
MRTFAIFSMVGPETPAKAPILPRAHGPSAQQQRRRHAYRVAESAPRTSPVV